MCETGPFRPSLVQFTKCRNRARSAPFPTAPVPTESICSVPVIPRRIHDRKHVGELCTPEWSGSIHALSTYYILMHTHRSIKCVLSIRTIAFECFVYICPYTNIYINIYIYIHEPIYWVQGCRRAYITSFNEWNRARYALMFLIDVCTLKHIYMICIDIIIAIV